MKLIAPGVTSKTINMDDFNECKAILHKSLKDLENRLTKSAYICGDQITIADLSAACELDQGRWISLDLSGYPKVKDWMKRVIYDDQINYGLTERLRKTAVKFSAELKKQQGLPKL